VDDRSSPTTAGEEAIFPPETTCRQRMRPFRIDSAYTVPWLLPT
jgi:hypothetical protein